MPVDELLEALEGEAGELRFEDFTSDLLRTLDYLGEARAHLVGLSMGGRIARNFALRHPERLSTLTLANTSPGFDALTAEEVRELFPYVGDTL
jgi:3-oxoadipate enol-lactonase